jgi:hypothetical protein
MLDGWHTVAGYKVYVEDGQIHRGILNPGWNERSGYVYRWSRNLRCWVNEPRISVDAFRAGVRRGTVTLQ